MGNNIYSEVAKNCSQFYPRFTALKSCPEASAPSCYNCRSFKNERCTLDVFDSIADSLF